MFHCFVLYLSFIGQVAQVQTQIIVWWMSGGWEKTFRNSFLSNYLSQPLDIWHASLTLGPISLDSISGLSLIHFWFIDLVKVSTIMVNGRNFRNSCLSNFISQPLDIWHTALKRGPIPWDSISSMSLIRFLLVYLVKCSTLMVNGRKLS
jgi:hypothetical protein